MSKGYVSPIEKNLSAPITPDDVDYILIDNVKDFTEVVKRFKMDYDFKQIAVDTETTDLNHEKAELVGIPFCFDFEESYYIPFGHWVGTNAPEELKDYFIKMLYQVQEKVWFFHVRFDLRILEQTCGLDMDRIDWFDTASIIYNVDVNMGKYLPISLKKVMSNIFDWEISDIDPTKLKAILPEKSLEYTCLDGLGTMMIPYVFRNTLKKLSTTINIDNKINAPVKEMEETLAPLDYEYYKRMKETTELKTDQFEKEIYQDLGRKINLNSPKQKREALKDLGIDTGVYTDSGNMSTGKNALKNIAGEYDFADKLIKYNQMRKHLNTYITPFIHEYERNRKQGGIYLSYHTTKSESSRLTGYSDKKNSFFARINPQSITKGDKVGYKIIEQDEPSVFGHYWKEVENDYDFKGQTLKNNPRHGIKAPDGYNWLSVDYSSQEIRILANVSGDEKLINFLLEGKDPHGYIKNSLLDEYGDYSRDTAKGLNFSIAYGAGAYNVSQQLDIEEEEAEEVLEKWKNLYPGIAKWMKKQKRDSKQNGYLQNYLGRVKYFEHWNNHQDFGMKMKGERIAGNYPIQSMGCEVCKLGIINVYNNLKPKYGDDILYSLMVHDEQNYYIKNDSIHTFTEMVIKIKEEMEVKIPGWEVPLECDIEIGTSFADVCPASIEDNTILLADEYPLKRKAIA